MPEIRQIRDLLKDDSSPEAMVIKEALRITETYNIVREAAGGPPGAGEPKGQASAPRAKGKKS
jgi:hypothetical protein